MQTTFFGHFEKIITQVKENSRYSYVEAIVISFISIRYSDAYYQLPDVRNNIKTFMEKN